MSAPAQAIDRAIAFVRAETHALQTDPDFDIHSSSLRKHRLLLDLHHLRPGRVTATQLDTLRDALEKNGSELAARLSVARRVAELVIGIAREDGRDGTYGVGSERS